ncbi:hypothetical protein L6452_12674 [Arctium lappa]|uniref:Uncharacterized protein n=1 Tax=Arctium lappa TaxID=4217 RepID=A0ACB9DQZ4_ARCLA|nr:hypothetical protein L6452_12674 [Arctium lappa]
MIVWFRPLPYRITILRVKEQLISCGEDTISPQEIKDTNIESLQNEESKVKGLDHGTQIKPNFLNFTELDFGNAYGMRRAFRDGDIKPQLISECTTKERMAKLSRYGNRKTKRSFGRKIKEEEGAKDRPFEGGYKENKFEKSDRSPVMWSDARESTIKGKEGNFVV